MSDLVGATNAISGVWGEAQAALERMSTMRDTYKALDSGEFYDALRLFRRSQENMYRLWRRLASESSLNKGDVDE